MYAGWLAITKIYGINFGYSPINEPSRVTVITPAMNSQAEPTKQVLVIYGDRRRPVTFNCGSNKDGDDCTKEEYEWLVKAVESVFEDVLSAEEGSSTSSGAFYLQMESSEWGGTVIDVTSRTLVPDHGVVFLHRHESRGSVGSKDYEKRGEKVWPS